LDLASRRSEFTLTLLQESLASLFCENADIDDVKFNFKPRKYGIPWDKRCGGTFIDYNCQRPNGLVNTLISEGKHRSTELVALEKPNVSPVVLTGRMGSRQKRKRQAPSREREQTTQRLALAYSSMVDRYDKDNERVSVLIIRALKLALSIVGSLWYCSTRQLSLVFCCEAAGVRRNQSFA
jgi:hypothetical protein